MPRFLSERLFQAGNPPCLPLVRSRWPSLVTQVLLHPNSRHKNERPLPHTIVRERIRGWSNCYSQATSGYRSHPTGKWKCYLGRTEIQHSSLWFYPFCWLRFLFHCLWHPSIVCIFYPFHQNPSAQSEPISLFSDAFVCPKHNPNLL